MKDRFHRVCSPLCKLAGMYWLKHQSSSLKSLSTSLSMVFSKNNVRLIGLNFLGPPQESLQVLGINNTLTWCHMAGMYPVASQARKILTSYGTRTFSPSCSRARNISSIIGLLYGANESIAHTTLPQVITLAATHQAKRLSRRAVAVTTSLSVATELGKWVASKRYKISPSDCISPPEGATKELSLILWSLYRALCNLADLGRSLMELQKVLQAFLEGFRTSSLYLHWTSL